MPPAQVIPQLRNGERPKQVWCCGQRGNAPRWSVSHSGREDSQHDNGNVDNDLKQLFVHGSLLEKSSGFLAAGRVRSVSCTQLVVDIRCKLLKPAWAKHCVKRLTNSHAIRNFCKNHHANSLCLRHRSVPFCFCRVSHSLTSATYPIGIGRTKQEPNLKKNQ